MSSLSDIKASLQNNWSSWDVSGDGKIDANDFLAAFDKNKDGVVGKDELQALADQLSSQLEYNNTLLEQMRQLEEMQLSGQRELILKQDTIKQLTETNQSYRGELSETKRKLKIAEEISDSMSKQCRDARIEANSLRREQENTVKGSEDNKSLVKELTEERIKLQKALKKCEETLQDVEDNSEQTRLDLLHQIDILRQSHEALSLEAAELRSKVIPLEGERKSLKEHVMSLGKSLEETASKYEEECRARMSGEKKIKDMMQAMDAMREKHREMQYLIQQANGKTDASSASLSQYQAQITQLEEQLTQTEQALTNLKQTYSNTIRDKENLEQELEQMGNELVSHAKQRQMDQEKWTSRLTNAYKDMERLTNETKAQADDFASESQRRTMEALESQKIAEEKYLNIQKECSELHGLIQQTQIDHQTAIEQWESQQDELENKISDLERRLELSGDEVENVHTILVADREKAQQIIRAIKNEMTNRGERLAAH
jgi:chromosome segregation ATPase